MMEKILGRSNTGGLPSPQESGLILLDRDGTLNSMVVDPEHGTIDSPLHPSQVKVYPWVPRALSLLNLSGFGLTIVTNQPAFAKGKTTIANLKAVHSKVIEIAETEGGKILSSHICFHQAGDGCDCRKPKAGLLRSAFEENPRFVRNRSWIIGDGVFDVQAGQALNLKTAFIGSKKWDAQRVFDEQHLQPTVWVENLLEFAEMAASGALKDM